MFLSAWCSHFLISHLEYSLHSGGVFSTQILTRLHTWGTVKCIKTHVQNQNKQQRRGRRRRVFFLSQRGDGRREYKGSAMYWIAPKAPYT